MIGCTPGTNYSLTDPIDGYEINMLRDISTYLLWDNITPACLDPQYFPSFNQSKSDQGYDIMIGGIPIWGTMHSFTLPYLPVSLKLVRIIDSSFKIWESVNDWLLKTPHIYIEWLSTCIH